MINVNQKILWLADYDLDQAYGGAQRSDSMIISQGKLLGFNILKITTKNISQELNIHDYDVLITSNIHALTSIRKDLIEEISKHKYHVRLEHDSNEHLSTEDRIKLFGSCAKTIFLTDFHYSFFKSFYGDIFKNVEIVYDPIDTNFFRNENLCREDKVLYAGYLHHLKGAYTFFEFALMNPNKKFVIAGWSDNYCINFLANNVPNVEYLGLIDHNQMPTIYNKYTSMFYEPNLNEPFCRSVAEAILCGMKIITSKIHKIGCITEIEKFGINDFREKCSKSGLKFWEII